MTVAQFKVVRIVSRSNFYSTGTKIFFYVFVSNYRNYAACNRQRQVFADLVLVAFIFRMYSYGGIA